MKELFEEKFGLSPLFVADAPGRVNLIGEHTDYSGGFVLPTAIPQKTTILLAPRDDREVHLYSAAFGPGQEWARYGLGEEHRQGQWSDYIAGVTWLIQQKNLALTGFNALIHSDIPIGAGLSSSAALLVAMFRGLRRLCQLAIDDVQIALLSQTVENEFVGARVGIMDQMAASLADRGTALFLDTRSLHFERIKLPMELMDLFIINSGIAHRLVDGGYNARREACEEAARVLGIPQLRDLQIHDLSRLDMLSPLLHKRARHVITENSRVQEAVQAILASDLQRLGTLMWASHASMRDDFEVSLPEIDFLVESARAQPGVYGARLTGGGFGGSIVGICEQGQGQVVAAEITRLYQQTWARQATVLLP